MKKLNFTLLSKQLVELSLNGPLLIMLIGAPGTGKSTFIGKLLEQLKLVVASTDDQIDAYAASKGITYSQAFKQINFKTLKKQMEQDILSAVRIDKSVIIDQTNIHRKSRKDKLAMAPRYQKVAVVFDVPEQQLLERLNAREAATGKAIPKFVLYSMLKAYEAPTRDEGFDECFELAQ